ncbi:MAG: glycosyltransferase family 4 protein [Myxococcales bacterium]|nr:glycosyltransferase family 4 protein [Myxococcales bacterium]
MTGAPSRPLRALVLTTSAPRSADDYAGTFVLEMAEALRSEGVDSRLAALPAPPGGALASVRSGLRGGLSLVGPLARWGAHAWAMGREDVDVTVAHWLVPSVFAARTGRPVVGVAHGSDATLLAERPWLKHAVLARLSGLIVVADAVRERLTSPSELPRALPTLVLPMGVRRENAPRSAATGPLEVLFVGRLVPAKGLAVLLDAVRGLEGVRLTIVGEGPDGPPPTREGVVWLGRRSPAEVQEIMARMDVVCVPSVGPEGMPRVALEAAAAGCVVIGTPVGGLATWLPPACVVSVGDAAGLRSALQRAARRELPAAPAVRSWTAIAPELARFLRAVALGHAVSTPLD